jgi:hypothetical protein
MFVYVFLYQSTCAVSRKHWPNTVPPAKGFLRKDRPPSKQVGAYPWWSFPTFQFANARGKDIRGQA